MHAWCGRSLNVGGDGPGDGEHVARGGGGGLHYSLHCRGQAYQMYLLYHESWIDNVDNVYPFVFFSSFSSSLHKVQPTKFSYICAKLWVWNIKMQFCLAFTETRLWLI